MEIMTWREAELRAAAHMRDLGFADAAATPVGADQGVDVVAEDGVAQVKHYANNSVGSPEIQRLKGAAHAVRWAIFYAHSGYTRAALSVASDAGVALFTYDSEVVVPVNEHAVKLSKNGFAPVSFGEATIAREELLQHIAEYGQQTLDMITEVGEVVMPVYEAVLANPQGVSDRQRELINLLDPLTNEGEEILKDLTSGDVAFADIVPKIARLEYVISVAAEFADVPVEELASRAREKRLESGFVPHGEFVQKDNTA